ncbi:MAG: hypothetical protein CTY17_08290 [Methylomonas sp.]|nr:MAG: hypothetical protein CTY23_04610 [Methylomonas sp.]PPD39305.1 MAG: hypothetical protein CTY17_08290 [Methylomonas sp.]PPD52524.1 MAG: hypothetical protein CTY11_08965 [Methylomonas sp.]
MAAAGVAVAATRTGQGKALAALTSAALGLPGISSQAAIPASTIIGNASYGHYQESDNRMQVSVYRADAVIPLTDRLELAFSLDRDTYSGATPAFSLPSSLALLPATEYLTGRTVFRDLVSAATGMFDASTITFKGGLETFHAVSARRSQLANEIANALNERRTAIDSSHQAAESSRTAAHQGDIANAGITHQATLNAISAGLSAVQTAYSTDITQLNQQRASAEADYLALNPRPSSIEFSTTVDFGTGTAVLNAGAFYGKANEPAIAGGLCPSGSCIVQNGMVVGTPSDISQQPNDQGHLHRGGSGSNRAINYHQDAPGIYIRALDSSAFSLNSIRVDTRYHDANNPYTPGQPGYDPALHNWHMLGFNSAVNRDLSDLNKNPICANFSTCVTSLSFANGFNGTLTLDNTWQNISAAWIVFSNFNSVSKITADPLDPSSIIPFDIQLDDINVSPSAVFVNWNSSLSTFRSNLNAQYDGLIAARTTRLNQDIANLNLDQNAINTANNQHAAALAALTTTYNNDLAALQQNRLTALADIPNLERQLQYNAHVARYAAILNAVTPSDTPALQRFAMQPQETRTMPQFAARYYFDATTLSFNGGLSDEPDFLSNFGSVNVNHEFNDKLTTLSFGYGKTSNHISRAMPRHTAAGHVHGGVAYASPKYPQLDETSQFDNVNLGLSHVLSKNTLLQTTLNYSHQRGYLSNPYKFVYVRGEVSPEEYVAIENTIGDPVKSVNFDWNAITHLEMVGIELFRDHRPRQRNMLSWSNRINQYLPSLDAAVHADYRFFADDWDINSHTFELRWLQSLPNGWTVTPGLRYYSQSQAEFFAPYFLAPRADGFYSSDFRLSGFGTVGGGITIGKEFARGIRLQTSFEYTSHSGNFKLGGGGVGDYADFDYFMAHANLSVDLSARSLGMMGGGGSDHSHHRHHHSAVIPAGLLCNGHLLGAADDFMVGYIFSHTAQSSPMYHGTSPVDDATLVNNACPGGANGCLYKPTYMTMQMHMLDIMYAPTDWMTLMLMPQLMSMEMGMSSALRRPVTGEMSHGAAGHASNDIGDTIVTALVKVAEEGNHTVFAGIGASAPTGSIDAQMSPPRLVSTTGTATEPGSANLQDYGMQLGSGTWDFKPSLTYTGHLDDWGWGLQASGTKRLEYNKYAYALGDQLQVSGWGSYALFDWLSATVRGAYTWQDQIQGRHNQALDTTAPMYFPSNYGGKFWDVGMGLSTTIQDGKFAGHGLAVEWLQPVHSDFNGYQLDRVGALTATWSFMF